jgi:hypothetical protein
MSSVTYSNYLLLQENPRTGEIKAHIVQPMKTFTCSYEDKIFKRTSHNPVWGVRQVKTT